MIVMNSSNYKYYCNLDFIIFTFWEYNSSFPQR